MSDDRRSYYYVNGRQIPLYRNPAAFAVRYRPSEHSQSPQLAPRSRRFLREDSNFVGRVPEYGLQIYQASVPPTGADGTDMERVEAETRFLNTSPAVDYVTPVFRQSPGTDMPMFVTNQFLVQFKPDVGHDQQQALHERYAVREVSKLPYVTNGCLLEATDLSQFDLIEIANAYFESGLVTFSNPNFIIWHASREVPGTAVEERAGLTGRRWHLELSHVVEAWAITRGDPGVVLAVLDDGIDVDHPEFSGRVIGQYDFDGHVTNGRPKLSSDNHGTCCASVAVAAGLKAFGVAPDCSLMAVRTPAWLATYDEADMFRWVADHGADVISCSWGPGDGMGPFPIPDATHAAIHYCLTNGRGGKGIPIFFAAGNGNESVSEDGYATDANVIAVAASTSEETRAPYSDFGPEIWVCAPSHGGTRSIYAADRRGGDGYNPQLGGPSDDSSYFDAFGGTSSATPLVAGIAALMLAVNDNLTAQEVREILCQTADRIGSDADYDSEGHSDQFGYGRVNALSAIEEAQARVVTPDEPAADQPSIDPQQASLARSGSAPRFDVNRGAYALYAVEVATRAVLLDAANHEAERNDREFYGSWQDRPLLSTPTYELPHDVWNHLEIHDRLYYRAHFADDQAWTNHTATLIDEDAASAPYIEITGTLPRTGVSTLTYPSGARFDVVTAPGDGRDYSDPTAGGAVPLIDTEGRSDEHLSNDFRVRDLASSDGARYARISPDLVARLQRLRDRVGAPIHVFSGYRHPALNEAVEGVGHSEHTAGRAADIYVDGMTPLELAERALEEMGCDMGIGLGPTTIHVDVRGTLSGWVYEGAELSAADFYLWVEERCVGRRSGPRAEITERVRPAIEGPESAPGGGPAPILTVRPGINRYYAVEVATDWRLYAPEQYNVERTADNFYGSWQDGLDEALSEATYQLPNEVWERLRGQGRLYYRLVTTSAPGTEWPNYQTSLPPDAVEGAPAIEITGGSRPRLDVPPVSVPSADELKWDMWRRLLGNRD